MLSEKMRELGFKITDRQFQIIQLVFTIGLMITLIVIAVIIFKYAAIIKVDPCSLCNQPILNLSFAG